MRTLSITLKIIDRSREVYSSYFTLTFNLNSDPLRQSDYRHKKTEPLLIRFFYAHTEIHRY